MKAAGKVAPQDFAGICGIYWEGSAWYDVLPADCATQGDVDLGKLCPVYACAQERGVAHCGMCSDFPCYLLVNLAAQTGGNDTRIESAVRRTEMGDKRGAEGGRGEKNRATAFRPPRHPLPAPAPPGRPGSPRAPRPRPPPRPAPPRPGRGH